MPRLARLATCALAVLVLSSTAISPVSADDCNLWDLIGTDAVGATYTSPSDPVHYENVGVVLSVRPVVDSRSASPDLVFILLDDAILYNTGTSREPRWEEISEREFRKLVVAIEDAGFDLTAEIVDEEVILGVVLLL
jgi:hypothetical protein